MIVKLDYDGRPLRRVEIQRRLLFAGFKLVRSYWFRSPSGRGWHVMMKLDPEPTDPAIVVALQSVLGSDPYREAANIQRVRNLGVVHPFWRADDDRWNVLYRESLQRACKNVE